jgi:flagellum-specific ATP synthase
VGERLLGRVVDGSGRPLDDLGPVPQDRQAPLYSRPVNPLDRAPIRTVLDTGVRAINALLTVGRGQRLGLFAGSGVGKSVLLGMMARYTNADVVVVGLIGERGREVKEFIENILGPEGRARSVVVAAPADTPPLLRLHGAAYATAVAEHFRDQGLQVLLIMDSLTRYAMAQREIALAIGEPPATRGYPPSVFAKLPQLVERAGNGRSGSGSITAFYTVLAEGDDQQDPIADSARAILDGHIVLSRSLADQGHYPAIDIEASISRAMNELVSVEEFALVRRFKYYYSRYQRSRDLISVGAYVRGGDRELDEAVALKVIAPALAHDEAAWQREGLVGLAQGWAIGTLAWRRALAKEHAARALTAGLPRAQRIELRQASWDASLSANLAKRGKTASDLTTQPKKQSWKIEMAGEIRQQTGAAIAWLAEHLQLGTANSLRGYLHQVKRANN